MEKIRVLDLFCGCGGLTTGLKEAGLDIIAGIDIWDKAIDSYKANHPEHLAVCADLKVLSPEIFSQEYNIEVGKVDVIVGGPSCQGYSMAGKRDINDPRNSLFMEFCKYLDYYRPKMFLMENVLGILSMKSSTGSNGEKIIDIIMEKLSQHYECQINKLCASDFEVPQNRRRVIIFGLRKDLCVDHKCNNNGNNRVVWDKMEPIKPVLKKEDRISVGSILEKEEDVAQRYFLSERAIAGIKAKKERSKKEHKGFGAQFLRLNEPSFTIPARYHKDGYDALVKYNEVKIRKLTITELKRIQTFPDSYILAGNNKEQIMQIGNAVACRFAYYLGKYIIEIFHTLS